MDGGWSGGEGMERRGCGAGERLGAAMIRI